MQRGHPAPALGHWAAESSWWPMAPFCGQEARHSLNMMLPGSREQGSGPGFTGPASLLHSHSFMICGQDKWSLQPAQAQPVLTSRPSSTSKAEEGIIPQVWSTSYMLNGRHLKYQAIKKMCCAFSNVHNTLKNHQRSACGLDLLLSMVNCTSLCDWLFEQSSIWI